MEIECRYCKGKEVVKYGFRNNRNGKNQLFMCKKCKKIFSENTTFPRMRHKGEVITAALDLYFKNVSLRRIKDHLKQIHGVDVTHVTILNWVRRYSTILKKYTDKIRVNNSDTIHADEMMVKVNGKWVWFWDVMDKETKYILSNHLSKARYVSDAKELFLDSKEKMSLKPDVIVTDGLNAYQGAYKKAFYTTPLPRTHHARLIKFRDKVNNNPIERLHGSIRERTKIMRGFKEFDSTKRILDGWTVYYNFLRPHMSLGITPAEAAGINLQLNGGNRWIELINRAIHENYDGVPLVYPGLIWAINKPEKIKMSRKTRCDKGMPRGQYKKTLKVIYRIRILTPDGKEYDDEDKKFKTEFETEEKAKESIEFYKLFYPHFTFRIEDKTNEI
jgi:transposase-like protein